MLSTITPPYSTPQHLTDHLAMGVASYRNTVVGTGDSIMRCQGASFNTCSFLEYCSIPSGGAMKVVANYGINGNKTADILARISSDALTQNALYVIVMEAVNDAMNGVTVSQHRTNMTGIIAAIKASGRIPIIVGAAPSNSWDTWKYNAADQQLCSSLGVTYVNPWFVCTANGHWIDATYSIDGTHPTPMASRKAGAALWSLLAPMFVGSQDLTWQNTDLSGLIPNGLFQNVQSAGSNGYVPTGWVGSTTTGITHSVAAIAQPGVGNYWQIAANNASSWAVSTMTGLSIPSGWTAGDTVRLSCRVNTSGFEANGSALAGSYPTQGKIGAYINLSWGGTSSSLLLREIDGDISGVFSVDGVIPSGATGAAMQVVIDPYSGSTVSGTLQIAQLQVHNLSLLSRM